MAQPEYSHGLMRVAGADAVRKASEEPAEVEQKPDIESLSGYLNSVWERNRDHKINSDVQEQMLTNLRNRDSQYEDSKLAAINNTGGSSVFMGLTGVKCGHAEAWLSDIFTSAERSWGLAPTPVPDVVSTVKMRVTAEVEAQLQAALQQGEVIPLDQLPQLRMVLEPKVVEAIDQEAKTRARRMELKLADYLEEGGWDDVFEDFLSDLVTLKAGIIKGPLFRKAKRVEWTRTPKGKRKRTAVSYIKPFFTRVSPLDFFPSPECVDTSMGDIVERVKMFRRDLIDLKDEKGYDPLAIDAVLENFYRVATELTDDTTEQERRDVENRDTEEEQERHDAIHGLEFWVSVSGKMLLDYGMEKGPDGEKLDPLCEYEINAIKVGDELIYIDFNEDPVQDRPYSVCGWRKVPGSFWYKGVPELMEDIQQVINAAARSLVNNLGVSSGPQAEVDTDRLMPGENLTLIEPFKIWQTYGNRGSSSPVVRFFQPDSNAGELLSIYDRFASLADDYTGIPAYAYGNDKVAGAGRTSSGLSMLMSAAAKGVKRAVLMIDQKIFKTVIQRLFNHEMEYGEDESIKGDIAIVTTGAVALMVKEQMSERRMQFLAQTNNPTDLKLTGLEGRAAMLREAVTSTEIDPQKVVKPSEEVKRLELQEQEQMKGAIDAQAQAQQMQLQVQMQQAQIALEQSKLQLQAAQLDMQKTQVEMQAKLADIQLKQEQLKINYEKMDRESTIKADLAHTKAADSQTKAQSAQVQSAKTAVDMLTQATPQEGDDDESQPNAGGAPGSFESSAVSGSESGGGVAGAAPSAPAKGKRPARSPKAGMGPGAGSGAGGSSGGSKPR